MTTASTTSESTRVPANDGIKETIESIVIAFILAFTFRAYVVEAFVIPTGSMAPTLLGQHMRIQCEQCGYRFEVDVPDHSVIKVGMQRIGTRPLERGETVICPMCHFSNALAKGTRPRAGDRILVHKFIYTLAEPNRYDVVVFKNPDNPNDNYIKRLVGLPDETLMIVEGNVYVKPRGADDSAFRIARKTDRIENPHAFKVQHAMWQHVYHSDFVPLDGGKPSARRDWQTWGVPWRAIDGDWKIENRRTYQLDSAEGGTILFDFVRQFPAGLDWYAYNQFQRVFNNQPIEEVRVAATVWPAQTGAAVRLSTTARLDQQNPDAQPIGVEARIEADGRIALYRQRPGEQDVWDPLPAAGQIAPLQPGRATTLELWCVDQEVSLWVEGRRELVWSYALPWAAILERKPLPANLYPRILITVQGSPVTLSQVEVDRDVAYTSGVPHQHRQGTMIKDYGFVNAAPIDLLPDHYFCLGDNSPLSHDGRFWDQVNPGVEKILLPDPAHRLGVVPERLMIGRAFFVYFPAPYPLTENGVGFVPDFGSMRFIR